MLWRTIFRSFDFERTWWRLLKIKKRVVRTKCDIYVFTITFSYFATFIVVADILNLISMQHFKSRKALFNNHSFTTWFQSNLEFIKRFALTFSKWVICYTSSHNSRYLIDKKHKLCRGPYNEYYWHATISSNIWNVTNSESIIGLSHVDFWMKTTLEETDNGQLRDTCNSIGHNTHN